MEAIPAIPLSYGTNTIRKPMLLLWLPGSLLLRLDVRQLTALLFHEPPRSTRFVPSIITRYRKERLYENTYYLHEKQNNNIPVRCTSEIFSKLCCSASSCLYYNNIQKVTAIRTFLTNEKQQSCIIFVETQLNSI
jgi:hypothetical protein